MTDWRTYAAALTANLAQSGTLTPDWRNAFEQVPRHAFVPQFFTDNDELIRGDDPTQRDRWLTTVYSDASLTTQIKSAPGTELTWPTSSSTRPSLMALMLQLLEVGDGQRILEIGTGTGYNAALLSHRLGAAHVTSIDVDPGLVDTARQRLADLGYEPHLYTGDGAHGAPAQAPYDRLIATCGVPAIPAAWITQLRLDAIIVADVRGGISSSLVVARKTTDHTATGRFTTNAGHFMWMRSHADNPLRNGGSISKHFDFDDPHTDTTAIPLAAFDDDDFRFGLQLAIPDIAAIGTTIRDNQDGIFLIFDEDDSWVEIRPDASHRSAVAYGGPRSLWPDIAEAWRRWNEQGRPARDRFGLTAHDDGRQTIWLDDQGNPVAQRPAEPPNDARDTQAAVQGQRS